ncbi:aromatic ring-hydroxylating oxygenase subunit alpha [Acanthopleuribacter pedis]|uniref:Aromatic ring-hydroxylating dioxygenase subunit alpha n=1 Tax=Acanthopleuribacter pedis TaxID=442870 RepID=A0A8J7QCY4_9BACT|nr:aromatic ring-hydroxylating dioxygenase subunit alpha [Acanthopleuribacter pedis]MBO1322227.1 aromatic ring-hydroxylating dioxygenase subunit alpha [Acanthopleuribacter pedis]
MIHLPKEAYTSAEWFDREQQTLFANQWQFLGFSEDLAKPGCYMTHQVGPYNLFVVKGRDHRLRAFHNICRHRGTQLLRATGKAEKTITCPYHDWTYSLNGELIGVPRQAEEFPNLDREKFCLFKASIETWLGMIWVHPDPNATPLPQWLQGVDHTIGPHRPEELVEYADGATDHVINANWKIVAENYIDGYHLAHLHSQTLTMYDHDRQQTGFVGPHFWFYEPLTDDYAANLKKQAPAPVIDHFTEAMPIGAYVPLLFPNLGITATESTWTIFHIIPMAADKTRVVTRTKLKPASDWEYSKQVMRSVSAFTGKKPKYADGDAEDPMASGDVMAEDIYVCEAQQRGMASPLYQIGALAAVQEASVAGFQKRVEEAMRAEVKPPAAWEV